MEVSQIVLLVTVALALGNKIRDATVSVASGGEITSADTDAKARRIRQLKAQAISSESIHGTRYAKQLITKVFKYAMRLKVARRQRNQ